ncbi:Fe-S oxidoreductase [Dunaliella salina]|uniref:Fe-S oxidoreductase n=1 Tax=Dunaliella salina TaxID=3046 RepID=A0ABQ7G4C5_DUNSA|nr:Fe-S oxidoreductase [Dunaliella salina]|eukprot:KAF5829463.1 Fe-S oxidoreductase [Dunaliella salina]
MNADVEFQQHLKSLAAKGQAALTREERLKRQRSLDSLGVPSFYAVAQSRGVTPLKRSATKILQLNIGLYCNQACSHCHVESSPKRKEVMDRETADRCLHLLRTAGPGAVQALDITGGAPELNPQFRYIVEEARKIGVPDIIDRCNLTALLEPGQEDLAEYLAQHRVHVVASLPCYGSENVDKQRGFGVFERSIEALKEKLEPAYRSELRGAYGIEFTSLLALNNMPIKRFADYLVKSKKLDEYMQLLLDNYNPAAAEGLMCRDTLSVGWDGRVYDCDFNQQLEIGMASPGSGRTHTSVFDLETLDDVENWRIACDNHCFGCTAGSGSGCGGQK